MYSRAASSNSVLMTISAMVTWLALGLQFYLIILNRVTPIPETITRFFSFFTILTNILVAVYFSSLGFFSKSKAGQFFSKPATATAITIYITLVGLGYQFLLRHIWDPKGWQYVADELLHSVIPFFALLYWILMVPKVKLKSKMIAIWIVYPVVYFILVMIRGAFSGFYPYYFIDVTQLRYAQVLKNSGALLVVFILLSALFIYIPKIRTQKINHTEMSNRNETRY